MNLVAIAEAQSHCPERIVYLRPEFHLITVKKVHDAHFIAKWTVFISSFNCYHILELIYMYSM